ncbi:hypothetical protein [Agrococcus terreus]|uniref:Lipoprotein n=1 Tax=Agrococcus terreus TaxID=574649 RepID=A0ABQ2KJK4_9MICO|nr:hypothetical protein [Agrococcus terreus]GGN85423.1 hypothetical protein GCM10010968_18080 [Agrococcus terreus]
MTKHRASLAAAAAAALAVAGLTACSGISDAFERVHSESFETRADAASGWVGVAAPAWLPADAVDIRSTATLDETHAVIAFRGAEPVGCALDARASLPFDGRYGGFAEGSELPDEVLRCGSYEVHETSEGWLAWFTATEPGETPAP